MHLKASARLTAGSVPIQLRGARRRRLGRRSSSERSDEHRPPLLQPPTGYASSKNGHVVPTQVVLQERPPMDDVRHRTPDPGALPAVPRDWDHGWVSDAAFRVRYGGI